VVLYKTPCNNSCDATLTELFLLAVSSLITISCVPSGFCNIKPSLVFASSLASFFFLSFKYFSVDLVVLNLLKPIPNPLASFSLVLVVFSYLLLIDSSNILLF
jgi:hypothetical protein